MLVQDLQKNSFQLFFLPSVDDVGLTKVRGQLPAAECSKECAKFQIIVPEKKIFKN